MQCCWKKVKKEGHLEEIEVGGRIILNRLFKFYWNEVKSTGFCQGGDNFSAFVITVLKIWFNKVFFFKKESFLSTLLQITQSIIPI